MFQAYRNGHDWTRSTIVDQGNMSQAKKQWNTSRRFGQEETQLQYQDEILNRLIQQYWDFWQYPLTLFKQEKIQDLYFW